MALVVSETVGHWSNVAQAVMISYYLHLYVWLPFYLAFSIRVMVRLQRKNVFHDSITRLEPQDGSRCCALASSSVTGLSIFYQCFRNAVKGSIFLSPTSDWLVARVSISSSTSSVAYIWIDNISCSPLLGTRPSFNSSQQA